MLSSPRPLFVAHQTFAGIVLHLQRGHRL